MSPDPLIRAGLPLDTHDPQSWNMYAYARNNPLRYTDPDGTNYLVCDQMRIPGEGDQRSGMIAIAIPG